MKTYTLTESELQELKKIRNYFGEHDKTPFEHSAFSFLDKLINSATEEVGIKEDDLQTGPCTIGNSIEKIEFAEWISKEGYQSFEVTGGCLWYKSHRNNDIISTHKLYQLFKNEKEISN